MIEFKNVTYVYGENTPFRRVAVDDVSFRIKAGAVTGLIGHSGSGKSTLAQLMNALISPTSGTVLLDGNDINESASSKRKARFGVGLVFQYPEYQLFEETVYKDIAFGPKNMGLDEKEIDQRVKTAARFTGITDEMLKKSPFELSGGQKRRAAIAGVIAMDPEVLVLDEPAAGLDPVGRREILGGLISYRKQRGNTLVIISHSMEDIAEYSDEILALCEGKVLLNGTPHEVFREAELLHKSGLSLPEVTELLFELKKRGADVETSLYTMDEAFDELIPKIKSQR